MWLNEELTAKVKELIESRKQFMDVEADMSAKLADVGILYLSTYLNKFDSKLTLSSYLGIYSVKHR